MPIFYDYEDRECFMVILRDVVKQFNWVVHAYCMMDNHYHLLVETVDGILSKGMRHLNVIKQDKGSVLIGNRNVDHISPGKRGIGFVFQNYALFSHLTVFENIAYGLRVNKEKEIVKKVCFFLQKFHLEEISHKYPHQLSGGQKQKVALIRALVIKPHILLMDEPMSNLDAPAREDIGDELKGIHREMKTTTLYVTHNQSEAVRLGDHISVMNQGRIEQTGTPDDVFHHPSTTFVSRFVGIRNIFKVRVIKILEQYVMVELLDKRSVLPVTFKVKKYPILEKLGKEIALCIHPEEISLNNANDSTNKNPCNKIPGRITHIEPGLFTIKVTLNLNGWELQTIITKHHFHFNCYDIVRISFPPDAPHPLCGKKCRDSKGQRRCNYDQISQYISIDSANHHDIIRHVIST